jgi:putative ABC transport system permease protein
MDTLWKDVRYSLRMLRRTPGVAVAAVIALALGIGANSALFSVVDGVLLRPLPYKDSHELYVIRGAFPEHGNVPVSVLELKDLNAMLHTVTSVGAFAQGDVNLTGGGLPPDRIPTGLASPELFPTLGATPILGRNFTADEEKRGADHVAILDYGFWQKRFAGDATVIGNEVMLDNEPYKIIGVLPAGFQIDQHCDLWVPLSQSTPMYDLRGAHWLKAIARVKPGTTAPQLAADLDAFTKRLSELYPKQYSRWTFSSRPYLDEVVGDVRAALFVLLGAVAFVLLIASANVANLMLARAAARNREMAIRTALGASRGRLIRQLLTESLLLAFIGGTLGLLLAVWGVDAMVALAPDALPRAQEITLDARVLAFTIGVSLVSGVVFGLMPALTGSRPDLHESLKDGTRGTSSSRGRLRKTLVVSEVALSLVLLVGAGLMLRSFLTLRSVDPGLHPEHVLTLRVSLPSPTGTPDAAERMRWVAWFDRALERLRGLPGVVEVGATTLLPFDGDTQDTSFDIEGYTPPPGSSPDNEIRSVEAGYFEAMGIPLVSGRLIGRGDTAEAPPIVVINQAMAKKYWPHENALGKRLKLHSSFAPQKDFSTVVGVVGDVRGYGLDQAPRAEMYFPYPQLRYPAALAVVLKTAGDPAALVPSVRAAIAEVDRQQPIFNVTPMTELIATSMAQRRFSLVLMLIFGATALLLAAVGIYGVMSYTVAQRTQEIGIRVALGASPSSVLGMVVRDGMRLVLIGLALGLAGAFATSRLVASLLYGVTATDLVTYGAIALVLALVALLATVIPARRATRVDPMLALRAD